MENMNNPYYGMLDKIEICGGKEFNCCKKIALQNAEISVPVELKPDVKVGEIETECCGEPKVECKNCKEGNGCTLVISQKISVKIPLQYNITTCVGEKNINCGCDRCRD